MAPLPHPIAKSVGKYLLTLIAVLKNKPDEKVKRKLLGCENDGKEENVEKDIDEVIEIEEDPVVEQPSPRPSLILNLIPILNLISSYPHFIKSTLYMISNIEECSLEDFHQNAKEYLMLQNCV